MVIKINAAKVQEKINDYENAQNKKVSPFVKFTEPGDYNVRPVLYPHSEDPAAEPFMEVSVHWINGIGYFYCPKDNEGKKCHVCEFVWSQVNDTNDGEVKKSWYKMLPQYMVLVPVLVRGQEEAGPKFLKIGSSKTRPSDKHDKLLKWAGNKDTCAFVDPDVGFDFILTYKATDPGQQKHLNGAKAIFKDIDLARTSTKFGKKGEYEAFCEAIPNLHDEVFPRKTTEDSLEAVKVIGERMGKKQPKRSAEELNSSDGTEVSAENKPETTSPEDVESKLKSLGL